MVMLFKPSQIRQIREAIGMTRMQFATELGVTEGAVFRWESDDYTRHPRFDTLVKINELAEQARKKGKLVLAS